MAIIREAPQIDRGIASMLDSAPAASIGVDSAGRITYQSPAAEALLGYELDEILGMSAEMLTAFDRAWLLQQMAWLRDRQVWSGRLLMTHAAGHTLPVAVNAFAGRVVGSRTEYIAFLHGVPSLESQPPAPEATELRTNLTAQDLRLLCLLVEDFSDQEIAMMLDAAAPSVEHEVHALVGKLGAHSRTEAGVLAHKHRLLG